MTSEDEKRLIVLSAVLGLGGDGTKQTVLDRVEQQQLMAFAEHDLTWRSSRSEVVWRSDLSFVRQHLVEAALLSNSTRGRWTITDAGRRHAKELLGRARRQTDLSHINRAALPAIANAVEPTPLSDESALAGESEFTEGNQVSRWGTRYERNPQLRAEAIRIHGLACKCCGFDFEARYGSIGAGFIEVHHVSPISEWGGEATVKPSIDLTVLCSNCHSMVHRRVDSPMTVDELRSLLSARSPN